MFGNPLKSLTFQNSNFSNEGSGFGARPASMNNQSQEIETGVEQPTIQQRNSATQQHQTAASGSDGRKEQSLDMPNAQWTLVRSQILQHWKQLSDQELQQTGGNFDKLCVLIQQHSSESRQEIESKLRQLINREPESEGSAALRQGR